jgi:hypothetical protein
MRLLGLLVGLVIGLVACSGPAPTGAKCTEPDPGTLTWESFGKDFMTKYCTWCHHSSLTRTQRHGAPLYHDFDTFVDTLKVANHIDEEAGFGPDAQNTYMPPDRCPSVIGGPIAKPCVRPTAEERRQLAEWLACEQARDHTFLDAGIDAP